MELALTGLTARGVFTLVRIVSGLYTRLRDDIESHRRVKRAIAAVKEYLGGRPDRIVKNEAKDLIVIRGDKKIRFDINNPGNDEPHFHIQRARHNGQKIDWKDAGPKHRYYFRSGGNR